MPPVILAATWHLDSPAKSLQLFIVAKLLHQPAHRSVVDHEILVGLEEGC